MLRACDSDAKLTAQIRLAVLVNERPTLHCLSRWRTLLLWTLESGAITAGLQSPVINTWYGPTIYCNELKIYGICLLHCYNCLAFEFYGWRETVYKQTVWIAFVTKMCS